MRSVARLIAISDAVAAFLVRAGLPASRITTIHYGLDGFQPRRLNCDQLRRYRGRAHARARDRSADQQKDHATLLRAFARVHVRRPDARLAILGWGPLEELTRALAFDLGVAEAVIVAGRVEPRDWLRRADVFAHSSAWEGFGLVLLEAMLARLPVVATAVSAVPEIVTPDTGILVPPGDAAALARALDGLIADAALRDRLGGAGLSRARAEFSVARMAERTIAVYEKAGT